MRRETSYVVVVVVLALLTGSVPIASAQPSQQQTQAIARFDEGRTLMKDGKFAAACTAFEQSQELDPASGTLYNLAGCYVKVGKLASAWGAYRELSERDTNATRRADATKQAGGLAPRLPRLVITAPDAPADLLVQLNGLDVTKLLGIDNPIDLGPHEVVARATGFAEARIAIDVTVEGKTTPVEIRLVPLAPAAVTTVAPDASTRAPASGTFEPAHHSRRKLYGAVTGGVGLVGIAAGVVFGSRARTRWHAAQAICGTDDQVCDNPALIQSANDLASEARSAARASTIFSIAGGVLIAAGVVIIVTAPHEHAVQLAPTASATGAGLTLGGTF